MVITTRTKADQNMITRTYPVRDLYQGPVGADADARVEKSGRAPVNGNTGMGMMNIDIEVAQLSDGAGGPGPAGAKDEAAPAAKQPQMPRRHADLIDAITNTIDPDSWEELSGPGTYTFVKETGCLVIRQTWAVHRQILQLLRDLREAKSLATGGEGKK
jgi:hypothetical protein